MMALCDTEFVGKIDDDLSLADPAVLQDCLGFLAKQDDDVIIGSHGIVLEPDKTYRESPGVNLPKVDSPVDIVKGRFWIARRSALLKAPFGAIAHDGDVSWPGFLANGRKCFHCVPGMLHGRFHNLPEGKEAVSSGQGHYERREVIRRQWFPF